MKKLLSASPARSLLAPACHPEYLLWDGGTAWDNFIAVTGSISRKIAKTGCNAPDKPPHNRLSFILTGSCKTTENFIKEMPAGLRYPEILTNLFSGIRRQGDIGITN